MTCHAHPGNAPQHVVRRTDTYRPRREVLGSPARGRPSRLVSPRSFPLSRSSFLADYTLIGTRPCALPLKNEQAKRILFSGLQKLKQARTGSHHKYSAGIVVPPTKVQDVCAAQIDHIVNINHPTYSKAPEIKA